MASVKIKPTAQGRRFVVRVVETDVVKEEAEPRAATIVGIVGGKLGLTSVFTDEGLSIRATVVQVEAHSVQRSLPTKCSAHRSESLADVGLELLKLHGNGDDGANGSRMILSSLQWRESSILVRSTCSCKPTALPGFFASEPYFALKLYRHSLKLDQANRSLVSSFLAARSQITSRLLRDTQQTGSGFTNVSLLRLPKSEPKISPEIKVMKDEAFHSGSDSVTRPCAIAYQSNKIVPFRSEKELIDGYTKDGFGLFRLFEDDSVRPADRYTLCKAISLSWVDIARQLVDSQLFRHMIEIVAQARQSHIVEPVLGFYSSSGEWVSDDAMVKAFRSTCEKTDKIKKAYLDAKKDGRLERSNFWTRYTEYASWDCKLASLIESDVRSQLKQFVEYNNLAPEEKAPFDSLMRLFVRIADNIPLKKRAFKRLRALRKTSIGKAFVNESNADFISRDQLIRDLVIQEKLCPNSPLQIAYVAYDINKSVSPCWNIGGNDFLDYPERYSNTIEHELARRRIGGDSAVTGRAIGGMLPDGVALACHTIRGISLLTFTAARPETPREFVIEHVREFLSATALRVDESEVLFDFEEDTPYVHGQAVQQFS